MSNITTPNRNAVSSVASLRQGLAQARARIPVAGGSPYLRLLKDGNWAFGQEENIVRDGTEAVVNTLSIQHGLVCWPRDDAKRSEGPLGEVMVPITQLPPTVDSLPVHDGDWKEQISFDVRFITGTHSGTQVLYKVNSVGGLTTASSLIDAIMARLDDPEAGDYILPIVELSSDSYRHKKYGKTYTPVLNVVGWADVEGREQGEDGAPAAIAAPEPKPEPEPEPEQSGFASRRGAARAEPEAEPAQEQPTRRRGAATAPQAPEVEPAPEAEAGGVRRRRRT